MATYKYQQNFYDGSSYGYVKYNIAPEFGTCVAPGETITITGEAYNNVTRTRKIEISINNDAQNTGVFEGVNVSFSKGSKKTFTIRVALPDRVSGWITSGRSADFPIEFTLWTEADGSGDGNGTVTNSAQKVRILGYRNAPTISSVSFSDSTGGYSRFGGYVQGQSDLSVSFYEYPDSGDPAVTIAKRALTLNGVTYDLASRSANIGKVDASGSVYWTLTVTDSKGKTSAASSGYLTFKSYYVPRFTALSVQRYRAQTSDSGYTAYVADDSGENVWITLGTDVAAVNSANAWTLSVKYGPEGGSTSSKTIRTGANGTTYSLTNDRSIVTASIPASSRYAFTFTLTDYFNTVEQIITVEKSGAYFDVEKYGVSVGQRSTGSASAKKFEVAPDYAAHFYGGAYGADGRRFDLNVQIHEFEDSEYASGFANYNNDLHKVTVARAGAVVQLSGIIKTTVSWASSSPATPLTLPEWARPNAVVHAIMQGSGTNVYWLRVYNDGRVVLERYRNGTTSATAAANAQITVSATWIAGDVYS